MYCTLNLESHHVDYTGTAAAWVDAYALAMGRMEPSLSIDECMAAGHLAEAGRGTCSPVVVAFLDVEVPLR